jgi:GDP-mannose 6-dehydrogenase
MGYVGAVSSSCLAEMGHEVIGVDINPQKIDAINSGQPPLVEAGIDTLLSKAVTDKRLRATTDTAEAVLGSDVSMICVGTPSDPGGVPALNAVDTVIAQIGEALRDKPESHTVVVRSTVSPGVTEEHIQPRLAEASGRSVGDGFELCFNPEFLREGSAVSDFFGPPFTLAGGVGTGGRQVLENLYASLDAPFIWADCRIAESVKYLSNAFHALKIAFANEAGALLNTFGIDSREAMRIFCMDRDLNISPAYLRPGFAFGGSCLPKEVRAFGALAKGRDLELPVFGSILASNSAHIERAFQLITREGRRHVALFGLAFKPGTDDLRESPFVTLAERLIGKGYKLTIYDRFVEIARLTGTNREYIDREIPHLETLMAPTPAEALSAAEVIVVGHVGPEETAAIVNGHGGRQIIDLQGVKALEELTDGDYEGICW